MKMVVTLQAMKSVQPTWFHPKTKRFFGDIRYLLLRGKKSNAYYLVRATYAWTDMFGKPRRLHWRVNFLDRELRIKELVESSFNTLNDVKEWLKEK